MFIDPELVSYAYRMHDYVCLSNADQIRLNILRLEVDRIRIELRRSMTVQGYTDMHPELPRPRCSICLETFNSTIVTVAALCGHVYCCTCYDRLSEEAANACALCREGLQRTALRLFFRFDALGLVVCKRCGVVFNYDSLIATLVCGCVYCNDCIEFQSARPQDGCFGCATVLDERNRPFRLHLSFN